MIWAIEWYQKLIRGESFPLLSVFGGTYIFPSNHGENMHQFEVIVLPGYFERIGTSI